MNSIFVYICLVGIPTVFTLKPSEQKYDADVVVLGAGAAGVTAVSRLRELGVTNVLVIEALDRVGGRVRAERFQGYSVETGCGWLQQVPETFPFLVEARRLGINLELTDYDDVISRLINGTGPANDTDPWNRMEKAWEYADTVARQMVQMKTYDASSKVILEEGGFMPCAQLDNVIDWYQTDYEVGQPPIATTTKYRPTSLPKLGDNDYVISGKGSPRRGLAEMFVYRLNKALRPSNLTSPAGNSTENSDRTSTMCENSSNATSGYECTPGVISPRLLLNTTASLISQNDSSITVHTKDGRTFTAKHAIYTFSLGVLKDWVKKDKFWPRLPVDKKNAINRFLYGHFVNFYFRFPSQFWGEDEYTLLASPMRGYFPVIHNFNKFFPGSNIIRVTMTGENADELVSKSPAEVMNKFHAWLRNYYGNSVPAPIDVLIPNWKDDRCFLGSFPDWPVGMTLAGHAHLQSKFQRLFFAGDAMDQNSVGYLTGAMMSARRVAEEIVACERPDKAGCPKEAKPQRPGCTYKAATNYDSDSTVDDGSCQFEDGPTASSSPPVYTTLCLIVTALLFLFK